MLITFDLLDERHTKEAQMTRKEQLVARVNAMAQALMQDEGLAAAMNASQATANERRSGAGGSNSSVQLLGNFGSDPFALSRFDLPAIKSLS